MDVEKNIKEKNKNNKPNSLFQKIRSNFICKKIFCLLKRNTKLSIIKYNNKIKNKLNITTDDYNEYFETEIELIPNKIQYGKFINIYDEFFCHKYVNDNEEEIKENYLIQNHNVSKIRIIIDFQINLFSRLFQDCKCIESISFKKFRRSDISDMSRMFDGCSYLNQLNFNDFNTDNVINMSAMFYGCSSLVELNLFNFNYNKLKNRIDYKFFVIIIFILLYFISNQK